ncbi:hypothetical protein DFH29DRAFT_884221 [Suillus ampliporus]|nr:hypothetical protein DFH29DRAFT_884221 [Suillus ampliporus]
MSLAKFTISFVAAAGSNICPATPDPIEMRLAPMHGLVTQFLKYLWWSRRVPQELALCEKISAGPGDGKLALIICVVLAGLYCAIPWILQLEVANCRWRMHIKCVEHVELDHTNWPPGG